MSEQNLKMAIIQTMRAYGFWCDRMQSGKILMNYGNRKTGMVVLADEGTPDLIACAKGKCLAIEVKKNKEEYEKWERQWQRYLKTGVAPKSNRRSIMQHHKQDEMHEAGVIVLNVHSLDDLKDDLRFLKLIK